MSIIVICFETMRSIHGAIKEILWTAVLLAVFLSMSHLIFGVWQPLIAVESGSMEPHIYKGDIVIVNAKKDVITWEEGKNLNYTSFGDYGDVILYRRFGTSEKVIHRAMYYVDVNEPMWEGGPSAPHSGYITKGDNPTTNKYYDQQGSVSYLTPVKDEWVVGVAEFRIPKVGYITLAFRKIIGGLILSLIHI